MPHPPQFLQTSSTTSNKLSNNSTQLFVTDSTTLNESNEEPESSVQHQTR